MSGLYFYAERPSRGVEPGAVNHPKTLSILIENDAQITLRSSARYIHLIQAIGCAWDRSSHADGTSLAGGQGRHYLTKHWTEKIKIRQFSLLLARLVIPG